MATGERCGEEEVMEEYKAMVEEYRAKIAELERVIETHNAEIERLRVHLGEKMPIADDKFSGGLLVDDGEWTYKTSQEVG